MAAAGLAGNFSSHGFCIGAVTVAAHNSISDHLVHALGWWTSNAYQMHIRIPSLSLQLS